MVFRLTVFFLLTAWGYLALLLVQRHGRASMGRITQSVALAALCAAVLAHWEPLTGAAGALGHALGFDRESFGEAAPAFVLGALFFATGLLPPALRRRALRYAAFGRAAAAQRLERAAAILSWQAVPRFERVLMQARGLMAQGRFEAARDLLREAMNGMAPGAAWATLAAELAETHAALREWDDLANLARDIRRIAPAHLGPRTLYMATRAHLETGDLREGVRALEEAESLRERGGRNDDPARFLAFVAAYALAGREDLLSDFLGDPSTPADLLPPAGRLYWLGVARAASGDAAGAMPFFRLALANLEEYEVGWRLAVEGRMREAEAMPPAPPDARDAAGRLPALWRRKAPVHPLTYGQGRDAATVALIALNAAVWGAVSLWQGHPLQDRLILFGANVPQWAAQGQIWRLASGMFLHAGLGHLFLNMYALWVLGGFVERLAGRSQMFLVYAVGGLAASACTAFLSPYPVSVGSSGAVLALLGAALALALRRRDLFPQRARRMYAMNYAYLAATSAAVGWFVPDVDNYAHLGGLAAGLAFGLFLIPAGRRRAVRRVAERAAALAAALLMGFWLWQAGADALAGGYPATVQLERRAVPELGVSLEVPRPWRRRGAGVPAAFVHAIVHRDLQAMHPQMLKYYDRLEIAPCDGEPAAPDEDAAPLDEDYDGPVQTVLRVERNGDRFRLAFVAGSYSAALAREKLYRKIAESLEVEGD